MKKSRSQSRKRIYYCIRAKMLMTIKDFVKNKAGVSYWTIYNRMYTRDIAPVLICNSKHYPVHYYREQDLIKILKMKVRKK